MEQNSTKFFKNRGLKRISIAIPLVTIGIYFLLYFTTGRSWITPLGAVLPGLISMLFFSIKYRISESNTIEFYSIFGKRKRLTLPIETISEICVKPYRLHIDYKNREDIYPRSIMLELNKEDMKIVVNELVKRNPQITVS